VNKRVTVQVWLKSAVLDPQGQAVQTALTREGLSGLVSVRQGKVFFLDFEDSAASDPIAQRELIEKLSRELLANPVIEDFEVVWPGGDA
jgi:phosphoribosylformylglycinamidine synthase PurS subunit